MNSDDLLRVIQAAGDSPEHVLQLRKLVVACAMAGDFTDENTTPSPSDILTRIEKARLQLVKEGTISKAKPLGSITAEDLSTDFPPNLAYVPLGNLARVEKGLTGIKDAKAGAFPLVVTAAERSSCDHADFTGPAAIVPLVSSTGHGNASINRLHYQEGKFALGTILAAILPFDGSAISARFIFEYLSAFKDQLLIPRMTGSANVTLTLGKLSSVPVPVICPEAQAIVDRMMALLDQLDAARAAREETRTRLTAATLSRA